MKGPTLISDPLLSVQPYSLAGMWSPMVSIEKSKNRDPKKTKKDMEKNRIKEERKERLIQVGKELKK